MARMTPRVLTEHESYWDLPVDGLCVNQIRLDYAFGLEFDDARGGFSIRINTPFMLKHSGRTIEYSSERLSELGPAIASLFGARVKDAKAFKNGSLEIALESDTVLSVDPHPDYEAWEFFARKANGVRVVAVPGGELAIWSDKNC